MARRSVSRRRCVLTSKTLISFSKFSTRDLGKRERISVFEFRLTVALLSPGKVESPCAAIITAQRPLTYSTYRRPPARKDALSRVPGLAAASSSGRQDDRSWLQVVRHSPVAGPNPGIRNCPPRDLAPLIDVFGGLQSIGKLNLFLCVQISDRRPI